MLRKIFITAPLTLVFIAIASFTVSPLQSQKPVLKTIIIDAGHGLPDPGAEGKYSTEADLTLAIALKLGQQLQSVLPDCKILYTRTDRNLPNGLSDLVAANRYRAQFANQNHGDLFIAIHCNDTRPEYHSEFTGYKTETYHKHGKKYTRKIKQYRYWTTPSETIGTETYVWAVGKNDSKKDFVSSNDSDELYGEKADSSANYFDSPDAKILASLKTKRYFDRSLLLANYVEDEFTKEGRESRGVKQRDYEGIWVLQATAMPSILVETGFISNPDEEDYLNSDKGQNEIAYAIMRAVLRYKTGIENNGSNGSISAQQ
ncbi:MAG: N-acetylmuramoyl-L-alanine amidase family protein [Chitinophagaceae bacterium]